MSGNVYPNPDPIIPCSVCQGNMTWRGRSVQRCTCSKWVHLKCSVLSFSKIRTLYSSHSWSCPLLRPYFFRRSLTCQHCDFVLGLLQLAYLHCSIWAPLLMQHSHPTLAFKPLIPSPPTLSLLPLHSHPHPMLLAASLHLLLPLFP